MNNSHFIPLSINRLILLSAIFLMAFFNVTFIENILTVYPLNSKNSGFLLVLLTGFTGIIAIVLALLCYRYTVKPVLISILLISSFTSYFMDSYQTIIDEAMLQNVLHTDINESLDLFSFQLLVYIIFLGVLPSYAIYRVPLKIKGAVQEIFARLKLILLILVIVFMGILSHGDFFSSFWREHKPLRYYANPSFYLYSIGQLLAANFKSKDLPLQSIALDARIDPVSSPKKLVIFVVGETLRADHFSLNGYQKETTPLLAKEKNLINFPNFWSCGTSTAVSVPCLFSKYGRDDYNKARIDNSENVLDILQRAGVAVLWLDNNSDDKGVAKRLEYRSYKNKEVNPVCDSECRDVGMLAHLPAYIHAHAQQDIFIVLHQMGNHGPAYYKRYPTAFEKFTPVCKSNQLENCSTVALNNTYDNAVLYTDYFLAESIKFLKSYDNSHQTALFYVSDHGESLGENGLYLHGLPNFIAPDVQRHVPAVLWLGKNFKGINSELLRQSAGAHYSHDYIFHSLLSLMTIKSRVYQEKLDFIKKHPL